jgi:N-acyl-D-aspartate/D-glutamate deacylase
MKNVIYSAVFIWGLMASLPFAYGGEGREEVFDLVLSGGRVIDPETNLDAERDVAITDGRIVAVSKMPLRGRTVVDVAGLVVAPGFIDLHAHAQMPMGQHFAVHDGVTTALELEAGAYPVMALGTHKPFDVEGKSLINFGASTSHIFARDRVFYNEKAATDAVDNVMKKLSNNRRSTKDKLTSNQQAQLKQYLLNGLEQGGLGIGVNLDYMNRAVTQDELEMVFEVAAKAKAPIFIHLRRNGPAGDPSGLIEAIELAEATGAQLHVVHIAANAINGTAEFVRLVREAKARGVEISMETYPYNTGGTPLTADVLDRDWQSIFGVTYEDIELVSTGERLTKETFDYYRKTKPESFTINYYNREQWTRVATEAPDVIIASDSLPMFGYEHKVHPMGVGSFTRVLGRYVREKGALTLSQAIAKMTLLPARVLESYSPNMARKGRISVGADADISIFDPEQVIDNATYREPYQKSSGMVHVLVGGEFVIRDAALNKGAFPGKRILSGR